MPAVSPITAIVAPPPTPNGDLHLGHLAGPYLAADVLARYLELRGHSPVKALSVDLHQSYVVTTAERLNVDPRELAAKSHREIQATLAAAEIEFDVGMPDHDYSAYVQNWFHRLYLSGALELRELTFPYDVRRGRALFESYASGRCPVCLCDTRGNICEACGHSNDASQLFDLYPTGGGRDDPVEMRSQRGVVLDLEPWRDALVISLSRMSPPLRPSLARLIREMLSSRLPSFPITFPSAWGIQAPFPDCEGLVLNVWAEMVPGHYYWLERAHAAAENTRPLIGKMSQARYVQYLGFDNSFFYALAHLALALSAREAGLEALVPDALITNEFYHLDNHKFSTSQGHLIWGRDFLREVPADEARFYFAWSNPEFQQSNFSRSDFEAVVATKYREPLARLQAILSDLPPKAASLQPGDLMGQALLDRLAWAYDSDHLSLRLAAQTIAAGLDVAADLGRPPVQVDRLRSLAQALAIGAAPLIPSAAAMIWNRLGNSGKPAWPSGEESLSVAAQ
jgi:methionyl-tRNA synthetase